MLKYEESMVIDKKNKICVKVNVNVTLKIINCN